ncbi:6259_t:CDS:2 [Diversispora eburnea]|uniref:6259_t:CDS:1 n=1 Tax=Diversispora eburnea TaxID=1213867 RepID=A0A9N9AA94_9GLOM|nr:6259_t:CDS:2 [Diversispora eburnea]
MEGLVGESSKTLVQRNNVPIINIVNHSLLQDPKDMPETAFVIAFCVKFNEALDNLLFWPEDLDRALCRTEESPLLDKLHRLFLKNLENSNKKIEKRKWVTTLSKLIDDRLRINDFYTDHNPIKLVKFDYYKLSVRDKVMIMQCLVSWQLISSNKIKELIRQQHHGLNEDEIRPLEVEVLGEDSKDARYYYLGIGARIYRETLITNSDNPSIMNIKWEAISTTVDDLKAFVNDRDEIDPDRSEKEKALYMKIVGQVIPYLEPLAEEKAQIETKMKIRDEKREIERIHQLKKIEQLHGDAEILPTRFRSRKNKSSNTINNASRISISKGNNLSNENSAIKTSNSSNENNDVKINNLSNENSAIKSSSGNLDLCNNIITDDNENNISISSTIANDHENDDQNKRNIKRNKAKSVNKGKKPINKITSSDEKSVDSGPISDQVILDDINGNILNNGDDPMIGSSKNVRIRNKRRKENHSHENDLNFIDCSNEKNVATDINFDDIPSLLTIKNDYGSCARRIKPITDANKAKNKLTCSENMIDKFKLEASLASLASLEASQSSPDMVELSTPSMERDERDERDYSDPETTNEISNHVNERPCENENTQKTSKMALDNLLIHEPSNEIMTLDVFNSRNSLSINDNIYDIESKILYNGSDQTSLNALATVASMVPPVRTDRASVNDTNNDSLMDKNNDNLELENKINDSSHLSRNKTSVASLLNNNEEISTNQENSTDLMPSYANIDNINVEENSGVNKSQKLLSDSPSEDFNKVSKKNKQPTDDSWLTSKRVKTVDSPTTTTSRNVSFAPVHNLLGWSLDHEFFEGQTSDEEDQNSVDEVFGIPGETDLSDVGSEDTVFTES